MADRIVDLEHFPWSEAAKRMLTYVTSHWYDKSYIGKWTYEVMGREVDWLFTLVEELPFQFFVDTATWGLVYHEQKYGLPMQPDNEDYESRRRAIREKRDTKAPMNPWRMEQIIQGVTGYEAHVYDINDGYDYGHPNVFSVQLEGDGALDISTALSKIRAIKQSHTRFEFSMLLMAILNEEMFAPHVTFRMPITWWDFILDGTYYLNGQRLLDGVYPTQFRPAFRTLVENENTWEGDVIHRLFYEPEEGISIVDHHRILLYWWENERMLNGGHSLDGKITLNQERPPIWLPIRNRILLDNSGDIGFNWYVPAQAVKLDGTVSLDGTVNLNSGREAL